MKMTSIAPGIPAIIVLSLVSIVSIIIAITYSNHHSARLDTNGLRWFFTKSPPKVRSTVTAFIALPFWIWAVYKVAKKGDPDLGSITFLLVIIASALNASSTVDGNNITYAKKTATILLLCNILLTLNYALPIFLMSFPVTFYIYLFIGMLYWTLMTVWNWRGYTLSADIARARKASPTNTQVPNQEYGSVV